MNLFAHGLYTLHMVSACFPFEPLEKCMTFKDIFPGLSRTLSVNFQDSPGSKWFSRTPRVLEFSTRKSGTFQEAWEPCVQLAVKDVDSIWPVSRSSQRSNHIATRADQAHPWTAGAGSRSRASQRSPGSEHNWDTSTTPLQCTTSFNQGDHYFSKRILHDFSMTKKNENHNLSAQNIFPN